MAQAPCAGGQLCWPAFCCPSVSGPLWAVAPTHRAADSGRKNGAARGALPRSLRLATPQGEGAQYGGRTWPYGTEVRTGKWAFQGLGWAWGAAAWEGNQATGQARVLREWHGRLRTSHTCDPFLTPETLEQFQLRSREDWLRFAA